MAHQHQAGLQHLGRIERLGIAGVLVRPGLLQQLRDDQAHALDLAVDQPDLVAGGRGGLAQRHLQQVEIALDDRDRIVDLVRNAGRELADRGQALAAHQLLLRGLQRRGALGHLGIKLLAPALQRAGLVVDRVEQMVERGAKPLDLAVGLQRPDPRRLAGLDPLHRLGHALERAEDARGRAQRPPGRQQHHHEEQQPDAGQHRVLHHHEGPLEKADIQHADPPAAGIRQRQIARDIPVLDDEGTPQPGLAAPEHRLAHRRRHPGADRTLGLRVAEQPHIGADAHIVEKERRGALAAEGQRAVRIDDPVDVVDDAQIAVEQHAALQPADRGAGGVLDARLRDQHQAARFGDPVARDRTVGVDQRDVRPLGQTRR